MQSTLPLFWGMFLVLTGGACRAGLHPVSGKPMGAITPSAGADIEEIQNGTLDAEEWEYFGPYNLVQGKLVVDLKSTGKVYFVAGLNSRQEPDIGVDQPLCMAAEVGPGSHCEIETPGSYYIGVQGLDTQNTFVLDIKTISSGQMDVSEQGALTRDETRSFGPYALSDGKLSFMLTIAGDIVFTVGPGTPQNAVETVITDPVCAQNDSEEQKSCEITKPGSYYVVLRGNNAQTSSFTLHVARESSAKATQVLTDTDAVERGLWKIVGPYELKSGSLSAYAQIHGDANLYVGPGVLVERNVQIREPLCLKNTSETEKTCQVAIPGSYYVGLLGVDEHTSFTLTIKYPAPTP